MDIFFFFIFILGLFVGSFLNVLSDRIPRDEDFIKSRSHCEKCKHILGFWDLLPLFSFFYLKAKCRYCHTPLSWYYPFSEALCGILFCLVYTVVGATNPSHLFFSLWIVSALLVIFSSDIKYMIIPDKVVFPTIISTFFYYVYLYQWSIENYLFSALISGIFFFFLFAITKGKGMGFGDVKLAALIGLLLGIPASIYAFYIAFLTGALVSFILILWKKKHFKSIIPFGPFLVVGSVVVFLFQTEIINFLKLVLPSLS